MSNRFITSLVFCFLVKSVGFGNTNFCYSLYSKNPGESLHLDNANNPNLGEKFNSGRLLGSNYPKDSIPAVEALNDFDRLMYKKSIDKGKELAIWQAYDKDGNLLLQSVGFEGERNSIGNYIPAELIYEHFLKLRNRVINEKIVGVRKVAFRHTHIATDSAAFSNGDVKVGYNYREFSDGTPAGQLINILLPDNSLTVLSGDFSVNIVNP